jgi:RNA-directed DNA polymerase
MVMTTLAHHIDIDLLREAYERTRKDAAPGVDDRTGADYAVNLEGNLRSLLERFKSGTYYAPPVRRVYIPKGDGHSMRPLGIPTFEDKVLQKAVVMVLEAIYEQDFLSCSYGYRPRRSAHQALEAVWRATMKGDGAWVVEADIKRFFDTVDHKHLRSILDQRVRDGVIRRGIDKWLKAGVQEDGAVTHPDEGTPQGGVVSPLLANVYLHEVLDKWFANVVKPNLRGQAELIRYADDFVVVFGRKDEAQQFMVRLAERFGQFGLRLHPEKTRLIDFRRPRHGDGPPGPGSFDLLGFRHHWAESWPSGKWVVRRKTAPDRFTRALRRLKEWCRMNRHTPVRDQHKVLSRKLQGHYGYYGITGNRCALDRMYYELQRVWRTWLNRRSQRARMIWSRFALLLQRYQLPQPRVKHSVFSSPAKP